MMYIKGTVERKKGLVTIGGVTKEEENFVCTAYKAGDPKPYTAIYPDRNDAVANVLKMMA